MGKAPVSSGEQSPSCKLSTCLGIKGAAAQSSGAGLLPSGSIAARDPWLLQHPLPLGARASGARAIPPFSQANPPGLEGGYWSVWGLWSPHPQRQLRAGTALLCTMRALRPAPHGQPRCAPAPPPQARPLHAGEFPGVSPAARPYLPAQSWKREEGAWGRPCRLGWSEGADGRLGGSG